MERPKHTQRHSDGQLIGRYTLKTARKHSRAYRLTLAKPRKPHDPAATYDALQTMHKARLCRRVARVAVRFFASPPSGWGGGGASLHVSIGEPSISAIVSRKWSDNGKWTSNWVSRSLSAPESTLQLLADPRQTENGQHWPAALIAPSGERLLTVSTVDGYAVAIQTGRGYADLTAVPGWTIKGQFTPATTRREAEAAIAAARAKRLAALVRARARRAKIAGVRVTLADSLAAGNCESESERTAQAIRARFGLPPDATSCTALQLLAVRNDRYARAAIAAAQKGA